MDKHFHSALANRTVMMGDDACGAIFSECRKYRYVLWRRWREGNAGRVLFIMLNPSTADHQTNDATIRRCLGYAKWWGFDGLTVCNLYAYRATYPRMLDTVHDPVGPENRAFLKSYAQSSGMVVCAWGTRGRVAGEAVACELDRWAVAPRLYALALTAAGVPRHPLRLRANLHPKVWRLLRAI